jgi:DNA repair protein RadC
LAASRSRTAHNSSHHAAGGSTRKKSDVERVGSDTGRLGLRTIANSRCRRDEKSTGQQGKNCDESLLRDLVNAIVGGESAALSKRLIDRYGTLAAIMRRFEAYVDSETEVSQEVAFFLSTLSHTMSRVLRFESLGLPIFAGTKSFISNLHYQMAHLDRESFRVLFLDSASRLKADETLWVGTVDRVQVYPREVVKRALEINATGLILIHNHPSGDPKPSKYDVAITNRLIEACSTFDLVIHDHIIIARSGWLSMSAEGLIGCRGGVRSAP